MYDDESLALPLDEAEPLPEPLHISEALDLLEASLFGKDAFLGERRPNRAGHRV
ncbi:MAG TPA: hypothetical protein VEA41_02140 [Salinarimonas sp.]|nr:hypothetical protein [Salinarimonas sp.]